MLFHKPTPGSVSFNYAENDPRIFHAVHQYGLAFELDDAGNIKVHTGPSDNRVEQKIGKVPKLMRDRLWELFAKKPNETYHIDCHMAAGFVGGQELSKHVEIPAGEVIPLEEAIRKFGTPCGMQIRVRHETVPFHSAVILSCSDTKPTEKNTMAYHKRGHGEGEMLPVAGVLRRYKFDPQKHELAFYAFSDASKGEQE